MKQSEPFIVTIVPEPPLFLDLAQSVDKACALIAQAHIHWQNPPAL